MAFTLKKYNLKGDVVGEVSLDEAFLDVKAHPQMIKDYIVALRKNARQWSANTKGRSEVKHTTKKPHPQKGTGSARQGSLVGPQFRGGGVVFGPKPKFDQHVRINRKERKLAVHAILASKIKGNEVLLLEDNALTKSLKAPKTKSVVTFLKKCGAEGRPTLFLGRGEENHNNFTLSMRNIPRSQFSLVANLNGYDLMRSRYLILSESALAELKEMFS